MTIRLKPDSTNPEPEPRTPNPEPNTEHELRTEHLEV